MQKKFLTGILTLAAVCLFAPSPAHAEDTNNSYTVEGSYTISIPTTVAVDTATNQGALSVTGTVQPYHQLDVSITSANEYILRCGSHKVPYTISKSALTYSATEQAAPFTDSITVDASDVSNATVSGEYTDTLTFTMSCLTQRYCLTFDANGGTVGESVRWLENGSEYGTLPVPTRTGYTFHGWYDAQENGTEVSESTLMPQNAVTVYAHWTANTYTVKYDSNNALHNSVSGSMADSAMTYDSGVGLSTCSFTSSDTGAHFAGWNTAADGTGTSYSENDVSNLASENGAEITLYAQWTYDNIVKVRFEDVNGNMDKYTQTVINETLPAGRTISWSIADLADYKTNQTQWERQWQTPADNGAVNYPTENASHITTIDIMRQVYYLDLNGQFYDVDGSALGGGGDLKHGDEITATATIEVNGVVEKEDVTDYFIQHRYGSTFKFTIIPQSGYEFTGISVAEGQSAAHIECNTSSYTVTGYVTGDRHVINSGPTGEYYATTVGIKMQKKAASSTTTDTEDQNSEDVTVVSEESLTEPEEPTDAEIVAEVEPELDVEVEETGEEA